MARRLAFAVIWVVCLCGMVPNARSALAISYTGGGSDGEFSPTTESAGVVEGVLTIDLGNALTAAWDHEITAPELADGSAVYGRGVYDAAKWAVVFKYSSVNIPAGITIKFTNHPSRAPVVWLVTGDVTIAGTVNLNGSDLVAPPLLAEPGPGGFRGGMGYNGPGSAGSAGFGPGGGSRKDNHGNAAAFGTTLSDAPTYGNPSLLPLVGGSGGSGDQDSSAGQGGGAGGGAMLVVTPGTLTITGSITANGGLGHSDYYNSSNRSGSGSGGGVRLVCTSLVTSSVGKIEARGGTSSYAGGLGRVRIERVNIDEGAGVLPITPTPSVVVHEDAATPLLWPENATDAPTVKILTIGGEAVPDDPRASFGAAGPDVSITQNTTTEVVVETTNVEEAAEVFVRVAARSNANYTRTQATKIEGLSLPAGTVRWTATVPVEEGHSAIQVHVIRP